MTILCQAFAEVIDTKSPYTYNHSIGVARAAVEIAEGLGLSDHTVTLVRRAALLHDIGKLSVPNSILEKPGSLTDEEWKVMKMHPVYTRLILQTISGFEHLAFVASAHHERLDGTGYPDGLAADELPLTARIICVADTYQAITEDRPYRNGLPRQAALNIMQKLVPSALDMDCVDVLRYGKGFGLPVTAAFQSHHRDIRWPPREPDAGTQKAADRLRLCEQLDLVNSLILVAQRFSAAITMIPFRSSALAAAGDQPYHDPFTPLHYSRSRNRLLSHSCPPEDSTEQRVLALESRRAKEIAQLIANNGGQPTVAPSTREVSSASSPEELRFASELLQDQLRRGHLHDRRGRPRSGPGGRAHLLPRAIHRGAKPHQSRRPRTQASRRPARTRRAGHIDRSRTQHLARNSAGARSESRENPACQASASPSRSTVFPALNCMPD